MQKGLLPKVNGPLPGELTKQWLERCRAALPDAVMSSNPIVIKEGRGAMIEDMDGNVFLDWTGGVGVLNVGHANPEISETIYEQSKKYVHSMMAVITHPAYVSLIEKLNEVVPARGYPRKAMLVNDGAESVENAVKIAKAYTKRPNVIVFSGAFHGRTALTMAMTAKKTYSLGMGPFPDGVYRVDYPNIYRAPGHMTKDEAIEYYLDRLKAIFVEGTPEESTAAIVIEPIQGEGGFTAAPIEWVQAVRKICDDKGIMLVADEVQCGFGRSGRLFVSDYWAEAGCAPDIIACAKSIAAGLPLGAVVASKEIMDSVPHGVIGGTFCGNAVACAAALKVIEIMERDKLPERASVIGGKLSDTASELQKEYPQIGDIRHKGAMIGIEFVEDPVSKKPAAALVGKIIKKAMGKGLILMNSGRYGNVIRFLCPLVVTDEQMNAGCEIFKEAVAEAVKEQAG